MELENDEQHTQKYLELQTLGEYREKLDAIFRQKMHELFQDELPEITNEKNRELTPEQRLRRICESYLALRKE